MTRCRFIYFDLGNVLVNFSHQRMVDQVAELTSQPPESVRRLLFDEGLQLAYERGAIDSAELHRQFTQRTGVSIGLNDLLAAWSDIFWLNAPLVPIVSQLLAGGARLGILSNTCPAHWEFVSGRFALLQDVFQATLLSYQLQSVKPEAAIFQRAIERAGVAPSEILFIDDREENVLGARDQGIDAVRYETPGLLAAAIRRRGFQFNY